VRTNHFFHGKVPGLRYARVPGHWPTGLALARRPSAWAVMLGLLAIAVLSIHAGQCQAKGPVLAAIKEISREGLYRETFSLDRDTEVEIQAVASGWPKEKILFSYPWLLDLRTRSVVWSMEPSAVFKCRHDNVRAKKVLRLRAGDYALYFSAIGGNFPIKKMIKFLKLFDLGTINVTGGMPTEWDRYGRPRDWHVTLRALDKNFPLEAVSSPARPPDLGEILRFQGMRSMEYRRARLVVTERVRLRLRAIGEYVAREQSFTDGAWIEDMDACERAWEMTLINTDPAGGAKKNRVFDDEMILTPGRFMVCYATDDSHATDDWNARPPFDPESWGLTLIPLDPIPRGALDVTLDPPDENVIARIDRVGDAEFVRTGFSLSHPADICIRAFGEWGRKRDAFLDFGWIEDAETLEEIWVMSPNRDSYAGGEYRNRLVLDGVRLAAGSYYVCYISDEAHSYRRWHNHPPYDPEAWGITLSGVGKGFSMDDVSLFSESEGPATVIRIGPVGDHKRKRVRFEVKEPMSLKVISLGEGSGGQMHDFGWLVREDTGETVWEMTYSNSQHAGGAKKNRRCEQVLSLDPGRYSLHYKSDDSHSFPDWNTCPPHDAHLWGVTLLELP